MADLVDPPSRSFGKVWLVNHYVWLATLIKFSFIIWRLCKHKKIWSNTIYTIYLQAWFCFQMVRQIEKKKNQTSLPPIQKFVCDFCGRVFFLDTRLLLIVENQWRKFQQNHEEYYNILVSLSEGLLNSELSNFRLYDGPLRDKL